MNKNDEALLYQNAEKYLPWQLSYNIYNSTIFPLWTIDSLYYFQEFKEKKILKKINLHTGKDNEVLHFEQICHELSLKLNTEVCHTEIAIDQIKIIDDPLRVAFNYLNSIWYYYVNDGKLIKNHEDEKRYLVSPDRNFALDLKDHDLYLVDINQNETERLTKDGKKYYDYGSSPETNTRAITQRLSKEIAKPIALWSPNSKKIVSHKLDQRDVKELYLLQNAPERSQRPILHKYRMSFSGDDNIPLAELIIIDVQSKKTITVKFPPLLSPYLTPLEFNWAWWSKNADKLYFICETRGAKEIKLCVTDASTGETKILIHEVAESSYVEPSQFAPWPHRVMMLEMLDKIIWMSEKSGYSQLYLYDFNGLELYQITNKEWCIRDIYFYDYESDWLYFSAFGYNKKIDPYYKQLFRCRLNGADLECLSKEEAHHTISFSPDKSCFLDTYSTISSAPISVLKKINGEIISHVETADISYLSSINWVRPRRICLKARDGKTDIYGNLYFPSHFDPSKSYPLIDHIYPGPQLYRTSQYFTLYGAIFRSAWIAQAIAELGFLVVHIDGFGTPGRSKEFHDATYLNIGDCGIPDHVEAIKQLAAENNYIDINRVGITGYSGGAYAAVRAMLMYPDFFKVGVAANGNHDLRCYPASYGEKYNGFNMDAFEYQSNAAHAHNLKGKLLLIHGEMDDNVHPCATMQLIKELIKHNKDFDMLIMPGQNHASTFDHPYYIRRLWDYFVRNLLGKEPASNYCVKQMPLNFPQIIDW